MARIVSTWKITFDPIGTPLVLMDYGQLIDADPKPGLRSPLEVVDLAGADFPFLRPLGNRRYELQWGVYQTLSTRILAQRSILDSLLTVGALGRKPLRIEIQGLTGTHWQFANAYVTEHAPSMSVERGYPRNLKTYSATATVFSRSGP